MSKFIIIKGRLINRSLIKECAWTDFGALHIKLHGMDDIFINGGDIGKFLNDIDCGEFANYRTPAKLT